MTYTEIADFTNDFTQRYVQIKGTNIIKTEEMLMAEQFQYELERYRKDIMSTKESFFNLLFNYIALLPNSDKTYIPPISCESRYLYHNPQAEINQRGVYLGSAGYVNPSSVLVNRQYDRLGNDFESNIIGYKTEIVTGIHFSITKQSSIFFGILQVAYSLVKMYTGGIFVESSWEFIVAIIDKILTYTNSTLNIGADNYYSWIACTSIKKFSNKELDEFLTMCTRKYPIEFYMKGENIDNLLNDILFLYYKYGINKGGIE